MADDNPFAQFGTPQPIAQPDSSSASTPDTDNPFAQFGAPKPMVKPAKETAEPTDTVPAPIASAEGVPIYADPDVQAKYNQAYSDIITKGTQPTGRLGNLAATVTDMPHEIYKAGAEAASGINAGLNPFSAERQQLVQQEVTHPGISSMWNSAAATGKGLLSVPALAMSPITGVARSVIGRPFSAVTGMPFDADEAARQGDTTGQTASDVADTAMMLIKPSPSTAEASFPHAPKPASLPPDPSATAGPLGQFTLTEGEETGNLALQQTEQRGRRNQAGERALKVAKEFDAQREAQLDTMQANVAKGLDPQGQQIASSPQEAAEIIQPRLQEAAADQQAKTAQAEADLNQRRVSAPSHLDMADDVTTVLRGTHAAAVDAGAQTGAELGAQREALRVGLNPQDNSVVAGSPQDAAVIVSQAIRDAEAGAASARDAAYKAKSEIPGEYDPKALKNSGNIIRQDMSSGPIADRVRVDPNLTPNASQALQFIDETIGGKPPQVMPNEATPFTPGRDPETGQITREQKPQPITGETMEDVRKVLNQYYGDAWRTSRSPGGNAADARAMSRLVDAFDDHIAGVEERGGFSGDADALAQARDAARAAHASYKQTFSSRGPGDQVGSTIENIVGRYADQQMPPNQIISSVYGNGAAPVKMIPRLQQILGTDSPAYTALRQGLFSNIVEASEGVTPFTPQKVADRAYTAVNGSGRALSEGYFSPQERQGMLAHADSSRAAVAPNPQADAMTDLVGKTGQMDSAQASDAIFGRRNNVGANPNGVKIAQHILDTQGQDSPAFQALRDGAVSKVLDTSSGRIGFDPKAIAARVRQFINGDGRSFSDIVLSDQNKADLLKYADDLDAHAATVNAPKNDVDRIMDRITGANGTQPATWREISDYLYSRSGIADKGTSTRLVQRLKDHFGETSPAYSAIKQGMWSKLTERPGDIPDFGAKMVADRIDEFNNSALGQAMYSPAERSLAQTYADLNRRTVFEQAATQHSNNRWLDAIASVSKNVTTAIGAYIGNHLWPGIGGEIGGAYAGAKFSDVMSSVSQNRVAKQLEKQMPIFSRQLENYQKALAAANRANSPASRAVATSAAAILVNNLSRMGITGLEKATNSN